jgi:hypothetical protein
VLKLQLLHVLAQVVGEHEVAADVCPAGSRSHSSLASYEPPAELSPGLHSRDFLPLRSRDAHMLSSQQCCKRQARTAYVCRGVTSIYDSVDHEHMHGCRSTSEHSTVAACRCRGAAAYSAVHESALARLLSRMMPRAYMETLELPLYQRFFDALVQHAKAG